MLVIVSSLITAAMQELRWSNVIEAKKHERDIVLMIG